MNDIKKRFETALKKFTDKIKPDPNVVAVILLGSLSNDTVWEKSDMDVKVIVRESSNIKTWSYCCEEDGLIINVDIYKEVDFKRSLERNLGGGMMAAFYSSAVVLYTADESLREAVGRANEIGADDIPLSFFHNAVLLIGIMDKIEKWIVVKKDPQYSQYWILKAADIYANMRLILDGRHINREAVLKVMEYDPEFIRPVYERPMKGDMTLEECRKIVDTFRQFLINNIDTIKKPVANYMSDGESHTVTGLVRRFGCSSHDIYHIFDFLEEMGIVGRVSNTVRITPKSRLSAEEVGFMYIEGFGSNNQFLLENDQTGRPEFMW